MTRDDDGDNYTRNLVLVALPAVISIIPDLYRMGRDWIESRKKRPVSPRKRKPKKASSSFHSYVQSQKQDE